MLNNKHNMLWEPYIEAARDAWWKGQHERAGEILVGVLREVEDFGELDPCLVRSIENLARLYFFNKNYLQAERLQKAVFETHEKLLGPDHPESARCFDRLAAILEARYAEESDSPDYCSDEDGEHSDDWAMLMLCEVGEKELAPAAYNEFFAGESAVPA